VRVLTGVRIALGLLACAGAPSGVLRAQQPDAALDGPRRIFQDSLVEKLTGDWTMTGRVRGRPAEYSLHAEWVLNHQFLQLRMRDVSQPPAYEATVYLGYDNASERYVSHWLDLFGGRFSETLGYGQRAGSAIRFVFEYPDGPFHTTFSWDPAARTWSVLMEDRGAGGVWQEFASYTLRRASAPESGRSRR
jgi:uncharacterized protein DUF1579